MKPNQPTERRPVSLWAKLGPMAVAALALAAVALLADVKAATVLAAVAR